MFRWYKHIQNLPEIKAFLLAQNRLLVSDPEQKLAFLEIKKKKKKGEWWSLFLYLLFLITIIVYNITIDQHMTLEYISGNPCILAVNKAWGNVNIEGYRKGLYT